MKKSNVFAYAVLGIAFILFNVIAFAVPTDKTAAFWITYIFSVIAFVLQIGIWKFAFKGEDSLKSKFLGIPIIYVGSVYLIVQIIAFAVFMAFPAIPSWVAVIVCALILGISAICLIGTETGREEINRVEEKIKKKVFYIKSLAVDSERLVARAKSESVKEECKKVYEAVCYSDPMSSDELASVESEITLVFSKLTDAVIADNSELVSQIAGELIVLLGDRNKKCKLFK